MCGGYGPSINFGSFETITLTHHIYSGRRSPSVVLTGEEAAAVLGLFRGAMMATFPYPLSAGMPGAADDGDTTPANHLGSPLGTWIVSAEQDPDSGVDALRITAYDKGFQYAITEAGAEDGDEPTVEAGTVYTYATNGNDTLFDALGDIFDEATAAN